MSRKDLFQTVTFRLNLKHETDSLIWRDLKSVDREPRKSIFGDKSKYIKCVLGRVAKDEYDMEENEKKLVEIKEDFMLSCQKELIETVGNEYEKIMDSIEKAVELSVRKAVADVLAAMISGGVSVSTPTNVTLEQSRYKIPAEESYTKMGVLPEIDENGALPSTAMNFLNGF